MASSDKDELKDLQKSLSDLLNPKRFGFKNGYIYSNITLKLLFELFIRKEKIEIKSSKANLDDLEIEYLTKLIRLPNTRFECFVF